MSVPPTKTVPKQRLLIGLMCWFQKHSWLAGSGHVQ